LPVLDVLAGDIHTAGSADGVGSAARFNDPLGLAIDSAGNIYVGDTGNSTIRMITPAGVVTTLAGSADGSGSANGLGSAARFNAPRGVAVDGVGNLYVADLNNNIIRKIVTATGLVSTFAGTAPGAGSANGMSTAAQFSSPTDVAVDSAGNVYVADAGNDEIRMITAQENVTTLAGAAQMQGSADGVSGARFFGPHGVAVDSAGNLYIADTGNNTIRKITAAGVTTLAGAAGMIGSADGGTAARFNGPFGVAVDSTGNVYVTDTGNRTIRMITPAGIVTTIGGVAGSSSSIVLGPDPRFVEPRYLAIMGDSLVITDTSAILIFRHVVH
jgi:hypothetical protein